jgi:hypothetical protein
MVLDTLAHTVTKGVDMAAALTDMVAPAPVDVGSRLQASTMDSLSLVDIPVAVSRDLSPEDLRPHPLAYHMDVAHSLTLFPDCPGHHRLVLDLPPSLHHKCNSTNNRSQTRLNATPTGMCATCVVLTWPTVTRACHAQPIFERPHMTSTSRDKTPSNILIWDIPVAPKIDTGCSFQTCDG